MDIQSFRLRLARVLPSVRAWHLFLLAVAIRLVALLLRGPVVGYSENLRAGFALEQHGYLGNVFAEPTGPTAHVAPGYPLIAAAVRSLFNDDMPAIHALRVLFAIAAAFNVALLFPLARTLQLPRGAALTAALLWMLPIMTWIELSAEHETVLTTTAVLVTVLIVSRQLLAGRWTLQAGFLAGIVAGIGAMFSPLLLSMVGVMGLAAAAALRPGWQRVVRYAAGGMAGTIIALTPYTIRNVLVMHGWFVVRDNFGLELQVSNNDDAAPDAYTNIELGRGMDTHPSHSGIAAITVRRIGEVDFNRERLRQATTWIRENPSAFAGLTLRRLALLIVPYSRRLYQRALTGTIVGLGIVGATYLVLYGHGVVVALILGAAWGYQCVFLLIQLDLRYVYPSLYLQSILAAYALYYGFARFRGLRPLPGQGKEPLVMQGGPVRG